MSAQRPERTTRGLLEEALTRSVIGSFYDVHRELGFGYRELIYALALERALMAKGHRVDREVAVMVYFRGEPLARQTLDMIVDDKLVVELKSSKRVNPEATQQLFGYLSGTNLELGLVLHFGKAARFYRVIFENKYKRRAPSNE